MVVTNSLLGTEIKCFQKNDERGYAEYQRQKLKNYSIYICRMKVNDVVRDEQSATRQDADITCRVKSA